MCQLMCLYFSCHSEGHLNRLLRQYSHRRPVVYCGLNTMRVPPPVGSGAISGRWGSVMAGVLANRGLTLLCMTFGGFETVATLHVPDCAGRRRLQSASLDRRCGFAAVRPVRSGTGGIRHKQPYPSRDHKAAQIGGFEVSFHFRDCSGCRPCCIKMDIIG